MNLLQFSAVACNMYPDTETYVLQARVKKTPVDKRANGRLQCDKCCFREQHGLCNLIGDKCDGFYYEMKKIPLK